MSAAPGDNRGGSKIPDSVIDEIKRRVDVAEVVGRHVELKRAGTAFKGLCPFHTEKSPSFTVSPQRQSYHCYGCGAHGDALQFRMEMEGMPFRETVEEMALAAGVPIPPPEPGAPVVRRPAPEVRNAMHMATDLAAGFYERTLQQAIALHRQRPDAPGFLVDAARYTVGKRRILQSTIERFRIGLAPDGWETLKGVDWPRGTFGPGQGDASSTLAAVDLIRAREERGDGEGSEGEVPHAPSQGPKSFYDTFRARLIFPVRDTAGKVVAFGGRKLIEDSTGAKYLNSAETPIFHKSNVLYGLFEARESIRRNKRALVVEGYMDVAMLSQYGVQNAVATMGTAMTETQLQTLLRFTDALVFVFDGDAAGMKAARKASDTILPLLRSNHDIRILTLPDGMDPDDAVQKLGSEAFETMVSGAPSLSYFLRDQLLEECGGLKSPEQRARFQQRFQQVLKCITSDATLAKEYWKMFQEALTGKTGALGFGKPSSGPGGSRPPFAPARPLQVSASERSIVAKLREAVRLAPDIALQERESIINLVDPHDPAETALVKDLDRLDDVFPVQRAAENTPEWLFARDVLLAHADLFEQYRKDQVRLELKAQREAGTITTADYIRELREIC
ncbi:DNA primase [uncultured Variovorax sp.]|uniref:DNA primase n=1 Tax=uncultured Variovorax sp. TaxID=114708 RepID=UPI002615E000|nr:DNA primase [uncultured Variovorax sp.]